MSTQGGRQVGRPDLAAPTAYSPDTEVSHAATVTVGRPRRLLGRSRLDRRVHQATHPVHHLEPDEQVGKRTLRQQQAIVRAIDAGDPDGAEAAMLEHLAYFEQHPRT